MSTTGRRGKGRISLRVFRHALVRPPGTEEEAIERRVRVFATAGSTGFEQDLDELRVGTATCGRPLSPSVSLLTLHTDISARSHRPGSSAPTMVGARDGEGAS
jgi:hypothetical protein